MIRSLLVYWQCPRHVMSLGGYPERISPWLAVLPHPCSVQPLLHSCVCIAWGHSNLLERSWHCCPLLWAVSSGAQALSPDICDEGAHAWPREKQSKTAEPKCEAVSLCWRPQGVQIPLKSLLQKSVWLQQFTGHGLLRLLQTTLRPAGCHTIMGRQKCKNMPEKERFAGHLHPRNLLSCPQIWMGRSTLDSPRVSSHYSLSSQKVKMLCPAQEGRQPNQVQTTPSITLLLLKTH